MIINFRKIFDEEKRQLKQEMAGVERFLYLGVNYNEKDGTVTIESFMEDARKPREFKFDTPEKFKRGNTHPDNKK
jgi:hypothetical protein